MTGMELNMRCVASDHVCALTGRLVTEGAKRESVIDLIAAICDMVDQPNPNAPPPRGLFA